MYGTVEEVEGAPLLPAARRAHRRLAPLPRHPAPEVNSLGLRANPSTFRVKMISQPELHSIMTAWGLREEPIREYSIGPDGSQAHWRLASLPRHPAEPRVVQEFRNNSTVVNILSSGRGTARADDAQGTPTQSLTSPSILVYKDYLLNEPHMNNPW